jgi:hypothetical protein
MFRTSRPLHTQGGSRKTSRRVAITDRHVVTICTFIEEWSGPITWDEIIDEAERTCGHRWTRQGIERRDEIKAAYLAKREAKPTQNPIDPAVALLTAKLERQEQEVSRLERLVASYKDLFIRYQANAHARGIAPAELEMPLPPIHKRRSDG